MTTFIQSLEHHLQTLTQRNIKAFIATIHETTITLILPNGKLIQNRNEFIQFHQSWIMDPDWRMTYQIVKTIESSEMAFALLLIHYDDLDSGGNPYHKEYYLHLVFVKDGDQWFLTYVQSTFKS
ncbi:YybH family protein [Marininema halotolerans]|uniref:SnoaL-like domain-containing protein n=1 Tax=Marininema halotolerans TaxID=1155944 RepID=A0A1I6U0Z5_9BACL|nr:nuclear transport factor 2 family protein [Marininema halotolerans]SFS95090.1 SnoaL-like domain-containing protein [Marininema halotolerans]